MKYLILIISIFGIHILAWLIPGPNIILIIRNSLIYSRKIGIWTALGIMLSNFVHITISITGLYLIISNYPIALHIIKYLGALYLIYLGIKTILIKTKDIKIKKGYDNEKGFSTLCAIKTGFVTNIFNPKAPLFFTSIFGSVMSMNPPIYVIIILFFMMPLTSLMMATVHSYVFSLKKIKYYYNKYQKTCNSILGALLIILGLLFVFY